MVPPSPADPRRSITTDAFQVAPELLGLPLAGPWRRLGAMLTDLLLLGLLVNAGGILLAIAGAVTVFRATSGGSGSLLRKGMRLMLRWSAAIVLFIAVLALWSEGEDLIERWGEDEEPTAPSVAGPSGRAPAGNVVLGGVGAARALADVGALARSASEEEALPVAVRLVERLREAGMPDEDLAEIQASAGDFTDAKLPPHAIAALRSAIQASLAAEGAGGRAIELAERTGTSPGDGAGEADATTESLLGSYAVALSDGDSAAAARLEAALAPRIAADTLDVLQGRIADLRNDVEDAERRLRAARAEVERRSGARWVVSFILEDLGLGFGWSGLYFTAFLVLMKGQTPGKRLFHARVIRLDGMPMGWWASFERFGGYGASIVTGLLGFAEILWDRNRQGMHDKIARTVVVRV